MEHSSSGCFAIEWEGLENIALERFRGNQLDPEILEEGQRWLLYIDEIFQPLIDTETGDFIHFPEEGSWLKQRYRLAQVMLKIQQYYKQVRYERASRVRV